MAARDFRGRIRWRGPVRLLRGDCVARVRYRDPHSAVTAAQRRVQGGVCTRPAVGAAPNRGARGRGLPAGRGQSGNHHRHEGSHAAAADPSGQRPDPARPASVDGAYQHGARPERAGSIGAVQSGAVVGPLSPAGDHRIRDGAQHAALGVARSAPRRRGRGRGALLAVAAARPDGDGARARRRRDRQPRGGRRSLGDGHHASRRGRRSRRAAVVRALDGRGAETARRRDPGRSRRSGRDGDGDLGVDRGDERLDTGDGRDVARPVAARGGASAAGASRRGRCRADSPDRGEARTGRRGGGPPQRRPLRSGPAAQRGTRPEHRAARQARR